MKAPTELNGYPVVRIEDHHNGYMTVMVKRNSLHDYVVATWWDDLGTTWSWGVYSVTQQEADTDFTIVCSRNAKRGTLNVG